MLKTITIPKADLFTVTDQIHKILYYDIQKTF